MPILQARGCHASPVTLRPARGGVCSRAACGPVSATPHAHPPRPLALPAGPISLAMAHRATPMPLPAATGVLGFSVAAILWLYGSAGRSCGSRPGRRRAFLFAVASTFVVRADASDIIVSGGCRVALGSTTPLSYLVQGTTASGAPYYRALHPWHDGSFYWLYWDPDCSGSSGNAARWIIASTAPSTIASYDLDGDGACAYVARIDSDDRTSPPQGFKTWRATGGNCGSGWRDTYVTISQLVDSPPPPPPPPSPRRGGSTKNSSTTSGSSLASSGTNEEASKGERSKGLQLATYVLGGLLGLIGLTLLVLLVVSCFTGRAKPQPTRAGTPNVNVAAGWGPYGFLFPKSWVYVWWGYLAMVLFSALILPQILDALTPSNVSSGMVTQSEVFETILSAGLFVHCILMPFLWTHKHREVQKKIQRQASAVNVVTSELNPEAKMVIFSARLGCGQRCTVLLADLTMGLVEFVLWVVKRGSLGTINLNAFWFPSPFYTFWKAKMHIGLFQINGAKICTTANQGDAYMKFCTEVMLNFWTMGAYGLCCSRRTSYGRWLDRHVVWQGAPPSGYNNRALPPSSSPPSTLLTPAPMIGADPHARTSSRVSYLRREAHLLPAGQGLPGWAAARRTRWVPLDTPVRPGTGSNMRAGQPILLCSRLPSHDSPAQDRRRALAIWIGASLVPVHGQVEQHEVWWLRSNVFKEIHLVQLHHQALHHRVLRPLWPEGQGLGR